MHEILRALAPQERVLDLGCRTGSFAASETAARVVRLDLEATELAGMLEGAWAVAGDARRLPFRDGAFAAIIANHSLEHVAGLSEALREMGRVLAGDGAIYIAVPDASTWCDRMYRWLARGGGHVNPIRSAGEFAALVARTTGREVMACRMLHTSYSYLNRHNTPRPSLKMLLLGGGDERILRAAQRLFAVCDRMLGTRLTVYGWAFYAGRIRALIDVTPRRNVCLRCGGGHEAARVAALAKGEGTYDCPACGAKNWRVRD